MSGNQNALRRYFKRFLILSSGIFALWVILALIVLAREKYLRGEDTVINLACNNERLLLQITQDRKHPYSRYLKGHTFQTNRPFVRIAKSIDVAEDYFIFGIPKNSSFPWFFGDFGAIDQSGALNELFRRGLTLKIDRRTLEIELQGSEEVTGVSQCEEVSEGQLLAKAKTRYKAAEKQYLEKTKDRKF
jgi:hypothetical protein